MKVAKRSKEKEGCEKEIFEEVKKCSTFAASKTLKLNIT
jgi:hypothetical protein